jgi:hypothetical protein
VDPATGSRQVLPVECGLDGQEVWADLGCARCGSQEFVRLPVGRDDDDWEPGQPTAEQLAQAAVAAVPIVTGMVPPLEPDRPLCGRPWGLELWHRRRGTGGPLDPWGWVPTETDLTKGVARDVRRGDRWLSFHGPPREVKLPDCLKRRIASKPLHHPRDDDVDDSPGSGDRAGRPAPDRSGKWIAGFFERLRKKHGYDATGEHWPDWWRWRKEGTS